MHTTIRTVLFAAALGVGFNALAGQDMTVYQDPDCGCCHGWAQYMRAEGFEIQEIPSRDMAAVKARLGVPPNLVSCHTAVVASSGQVIEGHVPAAAVRKLLADPRIRGVAAPGMPLNSPGMGKMDGRLTTLDFNGRHFSQD
ncbi:DUF411 domain-containing protein [Castellaniella hirudinis]|uniref:DUF411 domain-containing protein n=1 Tax=Castellaniella hirudinis TaxID=1144617 RepID=UPI0039C3E915